MPRKARKSAKKEKKPPCDPGTPTLKAAKSDDYITKALTPNQIPEEEDDEPDDEPDPFHYGYYGDSD